MPPTPLLWLYLSGNAILGIVLLGILARLTYRVIRVQGSSMFPTLVDGDSLIVFNWWPKCLLCKGQLVTSNASFAVTPGEKLQVKRIVATGGDTVITSLSDIQQKDLQCLLARYHNEHEQRIWQIPPRHVFLRGDNRAKSTDSLIAGPLPYDKIQGVVFMKLPHTFLLFSRERV